MKHSLRAKVTLGVVLPLVLILGVFTAIEYTRYRETALDNLSVLASNSSQVIEASLRHAMLESDFTELQAVLDAVGGSENLEIVYMLDTSGKVIFAPDAEDVGSRLDNSQPDCLPCHRLPAAARPNSVVATTRDGQRVFRSMEPIENEPACAECHGSEDRLRGLLLVDIPVGPMQSTLNADLYENLLWWAGTILVTVLVVNLAISRIVLGRLEGLTAAMADFGQGQPPPALAEGQPDEIGQLAGAFNKMAWQVDARNTENRQLSESLRRQSAQRGELLKRLITAQEDERKRVARELHDQLGQSLGGLALRAEAMERLIASDSERALEQLRLTRTLITETTDRMYDLILALRPSALDDLGLAAALRTYADRLLEGSGITFDLNADELTTRLPPETETALYRVFQEALSNVVRHAGAKQVRIALAQHDNVFEGEIVDDGRGFDREAARPDGQSPRGLGLLGMQERVTQCGGQLDIASRPGGGTQLRIRIPLVEEAPHG